MTDKQTLKKEIQKVQKWADGGKEAYALAANVSGANLRGESLPATPQNIKTTIQASLRQFLDGNIADATIVEALKNNNCDMENIRQWLSEQVLRNAIPNMIAKGDLNALIGLAKAAGENIDGDIAPSVVVQVAQADQIALANRHIDEFFEGKNE